MLILGIETSCDETAAAVLEQKNGCIQIISNIVASSASLQSKYGGIIPEQAAREQIKSIIPVIEEALEQAGLTRHPEFISGSLEIPKQVRNDAPAIDAIAVTYGPGLIGSLLVGVETAKTLATIWRKPLIPVNHLLGHFYANWIQAKHDVPTFPCIGLLVSGGHTDLVLFTDHNKYEYLGGTRDDASGECFDKCARLLGLPYPGGPEISKLAEKGHPDSFSLPRPMINSKDFDFSFSGLKTAVSNLIKVSPVIPARFARRAKAGIYTDKSHGSRIKSGMTTDLAASIEEAIVDVLVSKTIRAAKNHGVNQIMIAGGVAANKKLVNRLQVTVDSLKIKLHVPPPNLCTDNGSMIASAGFFTKPIDDILKVEANPNLALSD